MGNMQCKADDLRLVSTDECIRQMKKSKILSVRDQSTGSGGEMMGIPVEKVSFAEVNAAWESADKDMSKTVARTWKNNAIRVVNVTDETLATSAAMYLGMKEVLKKHGANAIAINCLGGFYGGHIHAYPCLGFHQLNNEGMVGACECDIRSTATMLTIGAMTRGRASFISDPVIDTAKRQIIYAHCVAPNKMFGPDGPANPYAILTHSEDRQGASLADVIGWKIVEEA
jgi:L-fucose isomerase-like protein